MSETHDHGHSHAKTHGGNHSTTDLESLQNSFMELCTDVGKLFDHVKGTARNGVGAVRHMATSAVGELKDRGEERVEQFSKKIEDHPLSSTAIAFGIGFMVAKLMGRK